MNVTVLVGGNNNSTTFSGVLHNNGWGTGPIGLTKVGTGTLTLTGANNFSGASVVSNGELVVSTTFAGNGNFLVSTGATLGVTNLSSTSAQVSNLTVATGAALEFQNVASTSTPLILAGNVVAGGSCAVKITGTGGLAVSNTYPLIGYAGSFSGSFTNLQLQLPPGWNATLASNANQIALNVMTVVSSTPPQVGVTLNGQQLQLLWPQDHTGWRLQVQTNSLGTNWFTVPGSVGTNQMLLPISAINGSVFYRLVYP